MATNDRQARLERARLRSYRARQEVHEHKRRRRLRDDVIAGVVAVLVIALAVAAQLFYFGGGPGTPAATTPPATTPPATTPAAEDGNQGDVPSADLAEGRVWTGTLSLNDVDLGIELDGAAAPQAVSSQISLVQSGFYDDGNCHRLTTEGLFVLQCGDPAGDGTGGPGYSYGPIENAPADGVYPAGTIAMARGGSAYSQGSQFFIVYADTTLDSSTGGYSVIGRVTSGLERLQADIIDAGVSPDSENPADGAPAVPVAITGFTIE